MAPWGFWSLPAGRNRQKEGLQFGATRAKLALHGAHTMSANAKIRLLNKLRDDILSSIADPWVFPEHGKVRGFLGPGPLMLVAERPSTGPVGGYPRFLYSLLDKYNATEAHLTDLIKSRGKVGEPYPADMAPHRRIFERELEIIEPTVIITFGKKVYDLLQFALADRRIAIRQVWHYAYARRGAEKAVAFENQMKHALGRAVR